MQRPQSVSTRYFFVFQTLAAAAVVLVFFAMKQPVTMIGAGSEESVPVQEAAPISWGVLRLPPVLRTNAVAEVRIGPSAGYEVVGMLPRNGRLDVVGRDDSGEWVAVAFIRGSKLYGWIPRTTVTGLRDMSRFQVVPVSLTQAD